MSAFQVDDDYLDVPETASLMGAEDRENEPAPLHKDGKRRTLVLCLLIGINLLNYLDRYTVSGVLPELKDHTKSGFNKDLSDSQGGLLMTAFVVSYMIVSPIFGYLGDRYNRKNLIVVGMLMWSLFTVGGSFSQSYTQLLIARGLVGTGIHPSLSWCTHAFLCHHVFACMHVSVHILSLGFQ
eukprot:TRINITY_DN9304_c0_g1_i1.p2 TRINITY_DN9304_c0_g1~~TRINITY_DN9304_c0_g1_i1.p2  ORF type:complete len:182 (+),score=12.15 TRINITY_DN9304_c0_g1_i1:277-822(+)